MELRFYLEKLSANDFEAFYSLAGNEQVMKMITGKPQTREEALAKFNALLENQSWKAALGSFMIFQQGSSELMGFAKLEIKADKQDEAELGYMLLPKFWGSGYGSEIADFLLREAESDPDLTRVYALVDPANTASRKILLRLGFNSEKKGQMDGLPTEIFGRKLR